MAMTAAMVSSEASHVRPPMQLLGCALLGLSIGWPCKRRRCDGTHQGPACWQRPSIACTALKTDAAAATEQPPLQAAALAPPSSMQHQPPQQPGGPHTSVLLREVLEYFSPLQVKVYVDCTLGAGGHAAAMVHAHPELRELGGVDLDPLAHRLAGERLARAAHPTLATHMLHGNYSQVRELLGRVASAGGPLVGRVDAMLMDLGVSSMQLDTPERGFSFQHDAPIDMRLDPGAALSAEEVVNTWSEAELGRILREYGEEKDWRGVARRLVQSREQAPLRTTQQLVDAIGHTIRRTKGSKGGGKQIHPATRTFQALRIAVNDEIRQLEEALPAALSCLAPGGRLAVISFHSLEDRLLKHAFLRAAGRPTPEDEARTYGPAGAAYLDALQARALGRGVTRKPVVAGEEEVAANPRARSAKLRVFERHGAGTEGCGGKSAGAGRWKAQARQDG